MSSNRLKLNPLKTELIWLHSSRRNPTFLRKDIVLFGSPITAVNVVRNLGVILDENMTMSEHIARVCRNCYYQLRQIRKIKGSLTDNSGASFQLFLGGPKFFFIFQCHRTIEKLEKTALYM